MDNKKRELEEKIKGLGGVVTSAPPSGIYTITVSVHKYVPVGLVKMENEVEEISKVFPNKVC